MDQKAFLDLYDFSNRTAVVTGGAGVLCASMAGMLARLQARVVVLDVDTAAAQNLTAEICSKGGEAMAAAADVLDKSSLEAALEQIKKRYGTVDILINGAGGNKAQATTSPELSFFDLPNEAVRGVVDLNLLGTIIPSQVFGRELARQKQGVILNIASMNALRPLTRIPVYSAAKAAVANFTQWLAVHMAREYSPAIRVNAIAPGFFLTTQNKYLLMEAESGKWTARGQAILDHTPMGRFGCPDDLLGTALWLISPAAAFVTGVVIPVDGGFSAYSGV